MKQSLSLILSAILLFAVAPHGIPPIQGLVLSQDTVAHGGGCRRSSPPGQCCHKERATGTVHCH